MTVYVPQPFRRAATAKRAREEGAACFGRAEAGLLQRFREGDPAALERIYRAHVDSVARAVAGTLRRYSRHGWQDGWREAAAEVPDLVQDVFARAFEPQARRRFDGTRDYGPYLSQIARNAVVDYLRRRRRQVIRNPAPLMDEAALRPAPHELGDDVGDLQIRALVGRYVARLPPDLRRVHDALYVQELSQREAAAELGLGRQVIRTLEFRLREGLRSALREVPNAK